MNRANIILEMAVIESKVEKLIEEVANARGGVRRADGNLKIARHDILWTVDVNGDRILTAKNDHERETKLDVGTVDEQKALFKAQYKADLLQMQHDALTERRRDLRAMLRDARDED